MQHILEFEKFVLNEETSKIYPSRTAPAVWPSKLEDSPNWDILKSMGFTEKGIITRTGTFVVQDPDGQEYSLTKSGYVRTSPTYMLTYAGPNNIDGMFLYLINKYLPSWKKKIGGNLNDDDLQILAKIQQLKDSEEKKLNLPTHPNLNSEQIKFLDLVCRDDKDVPSKWTYNNGEIDVQGDVKLKSNVKHPSYKGIGFSPRKHGIKFGHVEGKFDADSLGLRTMEGMGFPHTVDGIFTCSYNQLQSLAGSPQKVGGSFLCEGSELQSLEGAPQKVGGGFYCDYNKLQSLEGAPQKVGGDFSCVQNPLQTLAGAPFEIEGDFSCSKFLITNKGSWNPPSWSRESFSSKWDWEGWLKVLARGNPDAQRLMSTLPYLSPNWFNEELQRDPGKTVHLLASCWKNMPEDMKSKIKIPPGYEDEFDLFKGFDELGLF